MPPKTGGKGKNPNSLKNLKPIKKGETRNPKGRTVGSKNRSTILKELLALTVLDKEGRPIPNPLDKKQKKITYEVAVIARLIKKAVDGDIKAIREIQDTIHGKIKNEDDLTIKGAIEHVETKKIDLSKITSEELKSLDKIVSKAAVKTEK